MSTFRFRYWILWIAFLTFLLTLYFSKNQTVTERVYAQQIYPIITLVLSALSSLIPFSISDLIYMLLIFIILSTLVLIIAKRISIGKGLYTILAILALTYSLFYWFWGFNYFREPIEQRIPLQPFQPTKEAFYKELEAQIIATNQAYTDTFTLSKHEVESILNEAYLKIGPSLGMGHPKIFSASKSITFSRFFAGNSISGYYGPFASEVHINEYLLPIQYPMILAHEIAHQRGVTSEAEASFIGWLVCLNAQNRELEYSARLFVLMHFINQEKTLFDSLDVKLLLMPDVLNDYLMIKEYWKKLRYPQWQKITSTIYDQYLKANQVKTGIQDYQGVVSLIIKYQNHIRLNTLDSIKSVNISH